MKILHGTWIPNNTSEFIRQGQFYLWVETIPKPSRKKPSLRHPAHLEKAELAEFLRANLGIPELCQNGIKNRIFSQYFILPTTGDQPLPSVELFRYLEDEPPETCEFHPWEIDCYHLEDIVKNDPVKSVTKTLNDLHFIAINNLAEVQLGADLMFWYQYSQAFKQIILKDQYIPALKYATLTSTTGKGKKAKTVQTEEYYSSWEILSQQYETDIQQYSEAMPLACVAGFAAIPTPLEFYERSSLLRNFSECLLNNLVGETPITQTVSKQFDDSFIYTSKSSRKRSDVSREIYQQWSSWKDRLSSAQLTAPFYLCFQLQEGTAEEPDLWRIDFVASSKKDPSLKLPLEEYWSLSKAEKKTFHKNFGADFEKNLLLNLGYAARMYPLLSKGLETDRPTGLDLTLSEAFEFLKESAWILEDSGYKVIVPAWWTPEGRRRATLRLKASSKKKKSGGQAKKGLFSFQQIIQYKYELSIAGQPVSEAEWNQLVEAKTPLVQFRGEWIELDPKKMQQMLEFWQSHKDEQPEMSLQEFMQKISDASDEIEVEQDEVLAEMMAKLRDSSRLEPIENPAQLQGMLREYQKRGVAWVQYLEQLGLNGCLADDMGLGKSLQVIACLVLEREGEEKPLPTLLIAPTSVIGNWQREIERFAPHITSMIHHGSDRLKDEKEFKAESLKYDMVITSFTLARKDDQLFKGVKWHRVVVDEAQNIKNPQAAQTKAIAKLPSTHRLALTGTPIENRLLDLWSIFNFLNPGYLGKEAQFRKGFEMPIQKDNDPIKSITLKRLVEPFILRRVKTDRSIIKDLPDKVEQKQYCNLTKEQASLYEAVVKDVAEQLEQAEGIQRKGLILSTLMKLKQICNHPAQFLQDNSEFLPSRSHKLERLVEMLEEVIAEGESLLIFSQFTEICGALEKYLKQTFYYKTHYLHGGTPRQKREKMIAEFQDPETEPSIFILSLKAGGVGITLTKANHVFHFDRWWNPAVEDQATDRAFRIGQEKNVFVHKFIAIGTLEERIDRTLEDKKRLSSAIVGNDESWLTELDNDSFKQLIALNKQAILE